MFNLRVIRLLVAFITTSALAQDHSSEKSEAQISGAHRLPLMHRSSPRLPATLLRPMS